MNETALISEVLRLQDGRSQIKTIGTRRFEAGFGISRVPTLARESRFCAFWEEHVVSWWTFFPQKLYCLSPRCVSALSFKEILGQLPVLSGLCGKCMWNAQWRRPLKYCKRLTSHYVCEPGKNIFGWGMLRLRWKNIAPKREPHRWCAGSICQWPVVMIHACHILPYRCWNGVRKTVACLSSIPWSCCDKRTLCWNANFHPFAGPWKRYPDCRETFGFPTAISRGTFEVDSGA